MNGGTGHMVKSMYSCPDSGGSIPREIFGFYGDSWSNSCFFGKIELGKFYHTFLGFFLGRGEVGKFKKTKK